MFDHLASALANRYIFGLATRLAKGNILFQVKLVLNIYTYKCKYLAMSIPKKRTFIHLASAPAIRYIAGLATQLV